MSSKVGIVRKDGVIVRVEKSAFETDERLHVRAWYCANQDDAITEKTIADSHMWVNTKYLRMKYIDKHGN